MDSSQQTAPGKKLMLPGITYDDVIDKDIFALLKMDHLSLEEKQAMLDTMIKTVEERVLRRLANALSEEEFITLKAGLQNNDEAKITSIMQTKTKLLEDLWAEEAMIYKVELLDQVVPKDQAGKED